MEGTKTQVEVNQEQQGSEWVNNIPRVLNDFYNDCQLWNVKIDGQSVYDATDRLDRAGQKYLTITYRVPVAFDPKNYFMFRRVYVIDTKTGKADLSQIYALQAYMNTNSVQPVRMNIMNHRTCKTRTVEFYPAEPDGREIFMQNPQFYGDKNGHPSALKDQDLLAKADPRSVKLERDLIDGMGACQKIQASSEFALQHKTLLTALSQFVDTIEKQAPAEAPEEEKQVVEVFE